MKIVFGETDESVDIQIAYIGQFLLFATNCKTHLRRQPSRIVGNTGVEAARVGR